MLDIKFIANNRTDVERSAKSKGYAINTEKLLELDAERRGLQAKADDLRAKRNEIAATMKDGKPDPQLIEQGKALKTEIAEVETKIDALQAQINDLLEAIPNVIPTDTPEGGEEANRVERQWGDKPTHDFEAKDHLTLGEQRNWIDFERGAKAAGSKFYYLKGGMVRLELALTQYVMAKALSAGFEPMIVPNMVNTRTAAGTGYLPRGEERQIYKIEGEDLNLIATAEIPITGYFADEILEFDDDQPKLFAGYSPAYRVEAGAYGKHSRGLFRVHQFNKVEFYAFCKPEQSEQVHQKILALEEEICQELGLPYQVVRIAAGDMGAPAYKKYDVEYWSATEGGYRELMSCSNITTYQAKRLNIRYRTSDGGVETAATLNGTGMPMSRGPIAIIENYQMPDGKIKVPDVLQKFVGSDIL